jgi:sulfate adenylyltransferase
MIKPYQSEFLNSAYVHDDCERECLLAEAESLPSVVVSSAAASMLVMMGSGYFSPIDRFMDAEEMESVAFDMRLRDGRTMWPVPILCPVPPGAGGLIGHRRIALRDPNIIGNPVLAVMSLEGVQGPCDLRPVAKAVFRTDSSEHPGVRTFMSQGDVLLSGQVRVLNRSYFPHEFPGTFRTASQIRRELLHRKWPAAVAFQTRNPMHRAHEELCRMALEETGARGLLIHMLLGRLKKGDIPAAVRDEAIRAMAAERFGSGTVLIAGYGFDMLYAGPREAVLHAIMRQNAGCSHFIVGRDHAGVGKHYGPFEAQDLLDEVQDHLDIRIYKGDHTCWSRKLKKVVRMGDHPDHGPEDWLFLSGTRLRSMLAAGEKVPEEFTRPEVAAILERHYREEG